MTGVVLCGGQSLRMGQDKGLLVSRTERVWAEIMKEKFSQISLPSVVSINERQNGNYLQYFEEGELVVDNSNINIQGPLLGLLSAHLRYPDQELMVLACDLINMNDKVLIKLLSSYSTSKPEAIAFKGERVEPMCAIYSSLGLAKIYAAYRERKLIRNSMMHVLEELNAEYISILKEWKSSFKNFNSVEDLNEPKS